MCTIVLASRVWPEFPLIVAANRDEQLARASDPPALCTVAGTTIVAPRDAVAGGTWLGLSQHGLFVGITNRFDPAFFGRSMPGSRGTLVIDALSERTVEDAAARIEAVDPAGQGPFHLIIADRERAQRVWSDGVRMQREVLAPGLHVLTERSLGAAPTERDPLVHRLVTGAASGAPPTVAQWRGWLSVHADAPMEGTCVHGVDAYRGYGTRSSTIVMLPAGDGVAQFHHADGPPCTTDYTELRALTAAL